MRESTKRNIKQYTTTVLDVTTGLMFWSGVVLCVYAGYLYQHVYCNEQTYDK